VEDRVAGAGVPAVQDLVAELLGVGKHVAHHHEAGPHGNGELPQPGQLRQIPAHGDELDAELRLPLGALQPESLQILHVPANEIQLATLPYVGEALGGSAVCGNHQAVQLQIHQRLGHLRPQQHPVGDQVYLHPQPLGQGDHLQDVGVEQRLAEAPEAHTTEGVGLPQPFDEPPVDPPCP